LGASSKYTRQVAPASCRSCQDEGNISIHSVIIAQGTLETTTPP
jgi:hypothetical protein